jgi:hypothetical protein
LDSLTIDLTDLQYAQYYAQIKQKTTLIMHPGSPLHLNLTFNLPVTNALGWLNFLEFNAYRALRWVSPQMGFRNANTIGTTTISKFILTKSTPGLTVWNITDQGNIKRMNSIVSYDTISFILATDSLKEFFAFDGQSFDSVQRIGKVDNQNLHSLSPSTLIIVTHPLFLDEANRVANFHQQHNNM